MSPHDLRQALIDAIRGIAPEVDAEAIQPSTRLREDLELDSFDFLRLMVRISESLGVEVPESDYPKLATFGGAVDYLGKRLAVDFRGEPNRLPAR